MASAVEKERARRAEAERAYVAEADPVPWRDATVADRPTVTVTRIIEAALAKGWTVIEKYRETYAPPSWVAVDGEAHEYRSRVMKVYSLHAENTEAVQYARWFIMGIPEGTPLAVEIHFLDGKAIPVKLGYGGQSSWTPGPSIASVAKLIREAGR